MQQFSYLLINVLLPIFLQVAAGYWLHKRFQPDIGGMSKVQFYVFMPAIAFSSIYGTTLSGRLLIAIIASCLITVVLLFVLSLLTVKLVRLDESKRHALYNAVCLYNSGNYCIPLIQLLYNTPFSYSVQIVIMVIQSMITNTLGIYNCGNKKLDLRQLLRVVLLMPTTIAMLAAIIVRIFGIPVWKPIMVSLGVMGQGLVPLALVTLGAQLAAAKIGRFSLGVYLSSLLRLIICPLLVWGLVTLCGIQGVAAQVLIICSGAPSAVNTVVLALEFGGDADFASQSVLLSTLLSALTIPLVISLALHYV